MENDRTICMMEIHPDIIKRRRIAARMIRRQIYRSELLKRVHQLSSGPGTWYVRREDYPLKGAGLAAFVRGIL